MIVGGIAIEWEAMANSSVWCEIGAPIAPWGVQHARMCCTSMLHRRTRWPQTFRQLQVQSLYTLLRHLQVQHSLFTATCDRLEHTLNCNAGGVLICQTYYGSALRFSFPSSLFSVVSSFLSIPIQCRHYSSELALLGRAYFLLPQQH
jgi:hypothetical protein